MLRRTCILLAAIAVSCLPIIFGEPQQSYMTGYSGGGGFKVDSSSSTVNGNHLQRVNIDGYGISEHMEFRSPTSMSLSVFNSGSTLVVADPGSLNFLIFTETPGKLVIMKDGVCTEKSYRSGISSSSRQLSDGECNAVRRKASVELEKNRVYWDKWGKDFNKNMQDSFPPGFPFNNQQQNSGPSMFSGNFFKDMGSNMQKTFFPGFPFRYKK